MDFCHLHIHSEYSFLDGLCRIPQLVKQAKHLKMSALALTDHGGLWGIVPFYKKCKEAGIKPILGCEVYVVENHLKKQAYESIHHLVLLAEDNEGYGNLIKLVTKSHLEGFYHVPRVDKNMLLRYNRGLIALSGCIKGEIPHYILQNKLDKAKECARDYASIFPQGNFFLELQAQDQRQQNKVNFWLNHIAQSLGIPLVATNDVHFLHPEDYKYHQVLLSVNNGPISENLLSLPRRELYLKSSTEMSEIFSHYPEAVKNTMKIAQRCNVKLNLGNINLPKIKTPEKYDTQSFLEKLTMEGAQRRYQVPLSPKVKMRLQHELSIIKKMGYAGYFLIVKDIVDYAKNNNIPVGVGRGSATGSVVSYSLGIVDVDPLKYNLIFERFLNPERIKLPDIDVDLCHRGRHQVLQYLRERFGKEQTAHVGAFSTLQARAALRDTGKALGITPGKIDKLCSYIPYSHISLDDAIGQSPYLSALISCDKDTRETFNIAQQLQGLPRHMTQHSAGVVIAEKPLTEYISLERASGNEIITQADMNILEDLGLVKIDLLGLRFLTVIEDTLKLIKTRQGIDFSSEDIPLDDKKTFKALITGNTASTFQLESIGMRNLLKEVKPENIENLSAVLALYRPGPLKSGMTQQFIDRRHGKEPVVYPHPWLEPVLSHTYGVFIYQEQLMQTAHIIAGYTLGEADLLRRAIDKNNAGHYKTDFIERAKKKGVSEEKAKEIFSCLEAFGNFGFNKSHSISYAIMAYRTVFLKEHFPLEYFCALLTLYTDTPSRLELYLCEARRRGIKFLRPHINKSEIGFTPEGKKIRTGFATIKHLGLRGMKEILRVRKEKEFTSFFDFCHNIDHKIVNARAMESLILSGAFDDFGLTRPTLLLCLKSAIKEKSKYSNQISIFDQESPTKMLAEDVILEDFTLEQKLYHELNTLGHFITCHPMELWEATASFHHTHNINQILKNQIKGNVRISGILLDPRWSRTKQGNRILFALLEDLTGSIELVIFPQKLKFLEPMLIPNNPVVVEGVVNLKNGHKTIVVEKVKVLINQVQTSKI